LLSGKFLHGKFRPDLERLQDDRSRFIS